MNLTEALKQLDQSVIISIAKELKLMNENDNFSTKWIISLIANKLTDINYLQKFVFPCLSSEVQNEMIFYSYRSQLLSEVSIRELSRFGIVINKKIPSDIQEEIRKQSRTYVIKVFAEETKKVMYTPFLKCMLFFSYVAKVQQFVCKQTKNDKFVRKAIQSLYFFEEDRVWIYKFLDYFVCTGVLQKQDSKYSVDDDGLLIWRKRDITTNLKRFYQKLSPNFSVSWLQSIGQYQESPEEWIDLNILSVENLGYSLAIRYGLVEQIEKESRKFLRLTPEGWCLAKGISHPSWNENSFVVSAGFELFIPYHIDPFLIMEIGCALSLKDSDYFLVYDLMSIQEEKKYSVCRDSRQISYTILNKSTYIPDVVRYDLEHFI
ncbi:hypothetical protein [Bacillus cereus group sp. MYBK134-1]|uniref:hypothetical protein n=1 Tax=unclassified Bacillus cereus group TaxID=2750818 RepID=UPI003F7B2E66